MNKLENLLDIVKSNEVKINDLLHKKELEEKRKKGQQALPDFRYHSRRTAGSGYCIRSIQGIY